MLKSPSLCTPALNLGVNRPEQWKSNAAPLLFKTFDSASTGMSTMMTVYLYQYYFLLLSSPILGLLHACHFASAHLTLALGLHWL